MVEVSGGAGGGRNVGRKGKAHILHDTGRERGGRGGEGKEGWIAWWWWM